MFDIIINTDRMVILMPPCSRNGHRFGKRSVVNGVWYDF